MPWQMQINIGRTNPPNWVSVKAAEAEKPYEYETREEANHVLRLCYPDQLREDRSGSIPKQTRVIEVKDG